MNSNSSPKAAATPGASTSTERVTPSAAPTATSSPSTWCRAATYWKGFAKHGPLHNPRTYGYFDAIAYDGQKQGGHVTPGGIIYKGDHFPPEFQGRFLGANLLSNTVYFHDLETTGTPASPAALAVPCSTPTTLGSARSTCSPALRVLSMSSTGTTNGRATSTPATPGTRPTGASIASSTARLR